MPTPPTDASPGFLVEPPPGFCQEWLTQLKPVNSGTVDYTASEQAPWDNPSDVTGHCSIDPTGVPAAAAEGLDIAVLRLDFADTADLPPSWEVDEHPRLEEPLDSSDWESYLDKEWHDPLRGELRCWEVPDCDTGGDIDGQIFTYEFVAVYHNLYVTAKVQYLSPDLADAVEQRAREYALDTYAAYVSAVSESLPRE